MIRFRHRRSWLLVLVCLLLVIGLSALAYLTSTAVRLERNELETRQSAYTEQQLRLALWRIDSWLTPLVAEESAKPIRNYPNSPISAAALPISRRFEWSPTSKTAISDVPRESFETSLGELWYSLPPTEAVAVDDVEYRQRAGNLLNNRAMIQQLNSNSLSLEGDAVNTQPVFMTPSWVDEQLILSRQIIDGQGTRTLQGCLLDWELIRSQTLAMISDILPNASLEPVTSSSGNGSQNFLVTLPVQIVPGELRQAFEGRGTLTLMLSLAWLGILSAVAAGCGLVVALIQLDERRAAFVASVTHELRTPLTTLRMYSEMLTEGMIQGESQRQMYLTTIRDESLRLHHLVENVLSFSRLERTSDSCQMKPVELNALLERMLPRLSEISTRSKQPIRLPASGSAWRYVVDWPERWEAN